MQERFLETADSMLPERFHVRYIGEESFPLHKISPASVSSAI